MKGTFITFEGIEGCGKSTCIRWVARELRTHGRRVLLTREPGGTPEGRFIRKLLLGSTQPIDPHTELILYSVDRWLHVSKVIRPALRAGAVVLSDRYYDSTLAYQGAGRKIAPSFVRKWVLEVERLPLPARTILLDCPVEVGFNRVRGRGGALDRMEREARSFHGRVRKAYLRLVANDPTRIHLVDSSRPMESVLSDVWREVAPLLGRASWFERAA